MLRDPLPAYSDGEHPWQRGLTLMQGAINGVDCWGEFDRPGFGRTLQNDMSISRGPLSLSIATGNTWYEGDRPLMSDRRWYRLFETARDAVVLDVLFTLITDHGPVTIGSTKEGGFLSIRVNSTMDASGDGRMRNAYGAGDETGCWSRRAHWMDYCGPVGDETAGFAVFDHPDNLRYPRHGTCEGTDCSPRTAGWSGTTTNAPRTRKPPSGGVSSFIPVIRGRPP